MGKKKGKSGKPVGPLQRLVDRAANDTKRPFEVNEFAAQHGDYETNLRYIVNRGGTPLARWQKAGLISDTQQAAILHCIRLWEVTSSTTRLVANLDRTVFGAPGDGHTAEIEARQDLHRIRDGFPAEYWQIFENVVRFDMPAGTVGSDLSNNQKFAVDAARLIVGMVADMIYFRERLSY